ncbi:MAG: aspartyl protease family protein [Vicinamibacterales bacterium]
MQVRAQLAAVVLATAVPVLWTAARPRADVGALEVQFQLADQLAAESRYSEAIEVYESVKQSAGDTSERFRAGAGIVRAYLRLAEFERARSAAAELTQVAPQRADGVSLFGEALWASGLFDEAEATFKKAQTLNALDARAHNGLARALAARNQLDAALDESFTALKLGPREGDFHHTQGFIYERLHRFEEAAASYGNYVNLLPNKDRSDKAAWARAQIRFLRSFRNRVPLQLEGESTTGMHSVPFRLVRDKVVVKGKINDGRELDFVLDTGSEMTIVSRGNAQRLGVTPITYTLSAGVGEVGLRGLQVGRIDALQIGTLTVKNVPALIKNPELGGLPTREGEAFSPLALGLSMTIDYGKRVLYLGPKTTEEVKPTVELPLRLHRLAMVRGLLNQNSPASFVVDTGGEVISISQSTANTLDMESARHIPLKVYGTSGWDPDAFLLPGINLAFDNVRMDNLAVVVLNLRAPSALLGFQVGGIVGHKFLSQYRVAFDLEHSLLKLTRIAG